MKLTSVFLSIVLSAFWQAVHLHILYIFVPKSYRCAIGFMNNVVVLHTCINAVLML